MKQCNVASFNYLERWQEQSDFGFIEYMYIVINNVNIDIKLNPLNNKSFMF